MILVISAVGGFTYLQANQQLSEDVQIRMETAANSQATELGQWVERMKGETQTLAYAAPVQDDDPERISTFFTQQLDDGALPQEAVAVHYLDTETSTYRASSSADVVGADLAGSEVPWAGESLPLGDGDAYVSEPYAAPNTGAPVVAVIAAVPDQDGRAVALVLDLEAHSEAMPHALRQSFTKVVDSDGTTVLSHRTDQILVQNMGEEGVESVDSMAVMNGLDGASGYMEMSMGGSQMTMGYAPVEGTDWVVMTHSPKAAMFAIPQQISRNILLLIGATVLGFGVLGVTVGRTTLNALTRLTSKAEALEAGNLDVDVDSRRVDEIGQLYAAFGSMRDSLRERVQEAEQAQADAERKKRQSAELATHLEDKAADYREEMRRAADGDLSVRLDPESESQALTQVAEAFNAMIAELEETMIEIRSFADEVAAASDEVTAGTTETQRASEQVSDSIQAIAADAESQSNDLREVAGEMQSLSGTIEEVAASADEIATTSRQSAETGRDGRESASAAMDEMAAIETQVDKTVGEVESLADEVNAINDIVGVIDDIAEQTNMLALNASSEASRAGEAGDSFGVVADEIKELADEVAAATDEIERLILDVQSSADVAVSDIREMGDRVASGTATIDNALDALESVAGNVEDMNRGIQEISSATDDQAGSTEEVAAMIDDIADAAHQVNTESDTVSAAAEEQTSSLTQVAQSAETLADRAEALQTQLDTFDVGEDQTDRPSVRDTQDAPRGVGTATDGGSSK